MSKGECALHNQWCDWHLMCSTVSVSASDVDGLWTAREQELLQRMTDEELARLADLLERLAHDLRRQVLFQWREANSPAPSGN